MSPPLRPERGSGGIGCTEMRNQRGRAAPPRPRQAAAGGTPPSALGPAAPRATGGRSARQDSALPAKARSGAGTAASASRPSSRDRPRWRRARGRRRSAISAPCGRLSTKALVTSLRAWRLAEMQDADGAGEQAEHADHGEAGEDGEDEGLGHLARHHGEADGGHRQGQREQHHEPDAAVPRRYVGGGLGVAHGRVDIGHGMQNTRFELVLRRTLSWNASRRSPCASCSGLRPWQGIG